MDDGDYMNDDDDDDDDGFEVVRDAGRPAPRARSRLSEPITRDQAIEKLHHVHQMVLDDFVEEGEKECRRIMHARNLKTVPFTNTMLRQMAMTFPTTEAEMRRIPGIDQMKVDEYSKHFLALTRQWKQTLNEMMHGGANPNKPYDPNHQIVDLVSDDGGDTYGSEVEMSDEEQSSRFFGQETRAAADFNSRMEQATRNRMTQAAKTRKRPAADEGRSGPSRKRSSGGGSGKSNFYNKHAYKGNQAGSGTSRAGSGGGAVRRKSSSTYSANTGRAKSKGASAGGGTQRTLMAGGIGMMPT